MAACFRECVTRLCPGAVSYDAGVVRYLGVADDQQLSAIVVRAGQEFQGDGRYPAKHQDGDYREKDAGSTDQNRHAQKRENGCRHASREAVRAPSSIT